MSSQRHALVLSALVLFAVSHFARPASACSCAIERTGPFDVAPFNGAADVPLNARVWIGGQVAWTGEDGMPLFEDGPRAIRLQRLDEDSAEVEVAITQMVGWLRFASLTVLKPREPLVPNASYGVFVDDERISTFTTSSTTDEEPPPAPSVGSVSSRTDLGFVAGIGETSCPPSAFASADASGSGLFFVAEFVGDETFDPEAPEGEVRVLSAEPSFLFGQGGCMGNWEEAGPFASETFRVGAFDVAGNFSGWSEPRSFMMAAPGCSCGLVTDEGRSSLPGLLLASLLFVGALRPRAGRPRSLARVGSVTR